MVIELGPPAAPGGLVMPRPDRSSPGDSEKPSRPVADTGGWGAPPHTSLDSVVTNENKDGYCHPCGARGSWWGLDPETKRMFGIRCKTLTCPRCLPRQARLRQIAAAESWPDRMIGISLIADATTADPIKQARARMHDIRQWLKRKNSPMGEYCWTVEQNPRGTGYHAHLLQRGDYIPQGVLQAACKAAGAGIPYIKRIKDASPTVAGYGLKGFQVAGYGLKGFEGTSVGEHALKLNGGRLDHHSRLFYQVKGQPVTIKVAERHAQELLYGAPSGDLIYGEHHRIYALWLALKQGMTLDAAPPQKDFFPDDMV